VEWLNAVDTGYRQQLRELFEANFGRLEARMSALGSRVDAKLEALGSRLDLKLEALKSELLRWMFLFWIGTMGTVLAIVRF
jgi:uncharacterized protein YktB (UPF0637 family)